MERGETHREHFNPLALSVAVAGQSAMHLAREGENHRTSVFFTILPPFSDPQEQHWFVFFQGL